jgi:hypothetical protein
MSKLSGSRRARWPIAALALGLFAALGFAQAAKPVAQTSAQSAKATQAQKKLDTLFERFAKTEKELRGDDAKFREAAGKFLGEVEAVAREAKGTETAARAWSKYATVAGSIGSFEKMATAIDTLVAEHIGSPLLVDLPGKMKDERVLPPEQAEKHLRRMIEKSPDKAVQASSLLALGTSLMGGKKVTPEKTSEGRAMLERLQKDYAGVKSPNGQEYAAAAGAQLFTLDYLQIGKTPPDFEVTDENGVKFKLSDYRGKIVVLDFWGNW